MGIGPQNLGAAGMSTKSKPCGTPLKMAEDSPLAKALIGNQDRLPEQLKQKILAAPEDAKKGSPANKLESAKLEFGETDSDAKDKYKSTGINEKLNEIE